jgi:hypothetical protein
MSAAATAAGYLYASGRLRGRGAREQEHHHAEEKHAESQPREEIRVAVLPDENRQKKTPKIEYRTRKRWTPA